MTNLFGLDGRWVLVTGGTKGIGRAMADALAAAGANVAVTSRHADDARTVAAEVEDRYHVSTFGAACDVRDLAAVKGFVAELRDAAGGAVHGAVMNAGYPLLDAWWNTPLHEVPEENVTAWFDEVRATDVQGSRLLTWALLPDMVERGSGSLVYLSSTPALSGHQGTPYTEAKAALLGLMRDVAREYGGHGVRANAIAPGNIRTRWVETLSEEEYERLGREGSLGRWGEPDEVARVAVFLVSELSSFVSGQTLIVDGGQQIQ